MKKLLLITAISVTSLTSALGQSAPPMRVGDPRKCMYIIDRRMMQACLIQQGNAMREAQRKAAAELAASIQETQRKMEAERLAAAEEAQRKIEAERRAQETKWQADFLAYQQAGGPLDALTPDALNARINHDIQLGMSHPGDPAVVADLQAARKVQADRRAAALEEVSKKRDPNDVVAQVLNFSNFGKDEGEPDKFWYKIENCRYKLYGETSLRGVDSIDLNELDPRNIEFHSDPSGTLIGATMVQYNEDILMSRLWSNVPPNFDRLQRGWELIYSKYCTGKTKAF